MANFSEFLEAFRVRELKSPTPFAVVTLTKVLGSAPQELGARMVADEEGLFFGTVGGGKIEAHLLKLVQQKIAEKKFEIETVTVNLQRDIGMTCGGEVSFLVEFFGSEKQMQFAVFGAGHVSQELVPLLLKLNSRVKVFDSRSEWLTKYKGHPRLEVIETENMASVVATLLPGTHMILMTMGHATDVPILKEALKRDDWSYLGVIGSKQKRNSLEKSLLELKVEKEKFSKFKCPMGLELGNNEPFQISVSIVAEILS